MTVPRQGSEGPNEGRHRAEPARARKFGQAGGRPSSEALAREHEAARMRAKLMNPETAVRELAERLTFAHVNAGKPALSVLSEAVHYSKGTLSKVFAGKMIPSWPLVEDLAVELRVPTETVVREWFHLWTAANTLRRKPGAERPAAPAMPSGGASVKSAATGPGYTCQECGTWVVDPALHTGWHRQVGETGPSGPNSGPVAGWTLQARSSSLNHGTLGR